MIGDVGQHGISTAEGHHRDFAEEKSEGSKQAVPPENQHGQHNRRPPSKKSESDDAPRDGGSGRGRQLSPARG